MVARQRGSDDRGGRDPPGRSPRRVDDAAESDDSDLRRIDDRVNGLDAPLTEAADRDRGVRDLALLQPSRAGPLHEPLELPHQFGQGPLVGRSQPRRDETAGPEPNRNADVDLAARLEPAVEPEAVELRGLLERTRD